MRSTDSSHLIGMAAKTSVKIFVVYIVRGSVLDDRAVELNGGVWMCGLGMETGQLGSSLDVGMEKRRPRPIHSLVCLVCGTIPLCSQLISSAFSA